MNVSIDRAFVSAAMSVGGIDIVHEGGAFSVWNGLSYDSKKGVYDVNAQREYAEIKVFQSSRKAYALALTDEINGYFQAIIRYPSKTGQYPVKLKAEDFMRAMPVGSKITYAGVDVNIISASVKTLTIDSNFCKITVVSNFTAYVQRL